jgi:RAMP superfamily
MALDDEGRKAVAYLIRRGAKELRSPEANRKQLINLLYDFAGDIEGQEDEVIAAAARELIAGGAQAAIDKSVGSASASRPGGPRAGGSQKSPNSRPAYDASFVQAPYRFVQFENDVLLAPATLPAFNAAPAGFFSGSIELDWIAETPLLIGGAATASAAQDGVSEPVRIGRNGPHVIPGASIRGMIRSACEIIAFGRLQRGNWHHRYGLRDFDHPYYTSETTISDV